MKLLQLKRTNLYKSLYTLILLSAIFTGNISIADTTKNLYIINCSGETLLREDFGDASEAASLHKVKISVESSGDVQASQVLINPLSSAAQVVDLDGRDYVEVSLKGGADYKLCSDSPYVAVISAELVSDSNKIVTATLGATAMAGAITAIAMGSSSDSAKSGSSSESLTPISTTTSQTQTFSSSGSASNNSLSSSSTSSRGNISNLGCKDCASAAAADDCLNDLTPNPISPFK
jgi:hypothetical protein